MASSTSSNLISSKVNPDLQKERDAASFDTQELTVMFYGGPEMLKRRKYVESILLSDPHFDQSYRHTISPEEAYDRSIKRSVRWIKVKEKYNLNEPLDDSVMIRCMNHDMGLGIHALMFIPTIERLGTEEQQARWLPLAKEYKVLGTYAQTELGHGTYLQGLETTATYDAKTEEFVLNSPTLSAMKWWPGGLGKSATHCVLMAQLIIDGRRLGLHCFLIQLRSLVTHEPLPGRTIGDIGKKFSFVGIDNGFLLLDNVRIPRENMLMKYAEVLPNGTYRPRGDPKVTYGSMVFVRTKIVEACSMEIGKAVTIATRYAAIRKQGSIEKGQPEVPILDYQTQQQKLFPGLAAVYAIRFISNHLEEMYHENEARLQRRDFSLLPELHALCSGLKAVVTREAVYHIEMCRFACGGHGVMSQSALPELYAGFSASCTYEGENTVMLLQAAGYLVKTLTKVQSGETIQGLGAYLAEEPQERWPCSHQESALNGQLIIAAYKRRAQRLSRKAGERLARLVGSGMSQRHAWNNSGVDLVKAAQAHTQYFMVKSFYEGVDYVKVSPNLKRILSTLSHLYALYHIEQNQGEFIADGYISSEQLDWLHDHYLDTLALIRPEAVALVDALDIHDNFLQSTLGCYDGNVYQRMYEYAKTDPKNKTEVYETYYKYLRPLLKGTMAKL